MKIKQLVDRYGSNRMNAAEPGKLLKGCTCIAVPFAGGMCEIPYMTANIINVNDLDRHVINLCRVIANERERLVIRLDGAAFHGDTLKESQQYCRDVESAMRKPELIHEFDYDFFWAYHYFIASWMTRGGSGGTKGEFEQGMSIRWKSGGGDSVVRFRNAAEGIAAWEKVMRICTFTTLDAFDFIGECKKRDIPENGIYCDPPWPEDGDNYKHGAFDELVNWSDGAGPMERISKHEVLARMLRSFERTKIVVRLNDHPIVHELYPESDWTWHRLESRTQANKGKAEVLLTRNV